MHTDSAVRTIQEPRANELAPISLLPAIRQFLNRHNEAAGRFRSSEQRRYRQEWRQTHQFHVCGDVCSEWVTSGVGATIGLPMGLFTPFRDAGCIDNTFASEPHMRIEEQPHPMAALHFVTVHHSMAHPDTQSCVAWNHDTNQALDAMHVRAQELHETFAGKIVAIPTLIGTDRDNITLYGPKGSVDVIAYADSALQGAELATTVLARIRTVFPKDWEPIQRLERPEWKNAFHGELQERVLANIHFLRSASERQPLDLADLTDHKERVMFIGRRLESGERDCAFLVEDRHFKRIMENVLIGLPFVIANSIRDAVKNDDRNWGIPFIIGLPCAPTEHARRDARIEAFRLWNGDLMEKRPGIRERVMQQRAPIVDAVYRRLQRMPAFEIPEWIKREELTQEITIRLQCCLCLSNLETGDLTISNIAI